MHAKVTVRNDVVHIAFGRKRIKIKQDQLSDLSNLLDSLAECESASCRDDARGAFVTIVPGDQGGFVVVWIELHSMIMETFASANLKDVLFSFIERTFSARS